MIVLNKESPMLVIARRAKQTLMINDDIEITILNLGSGQVRLGIDAPQDVKIYRKELYEKIFGDKNEEEKQDIIL